MAKIKRYSIVLRGRVQDVGFRTLIMGTAVKYNIRGYPPANDRDGSVKMICEGEEELLEKFLDEINVREEVPSGIKVERLEKKEILPEFPIPVSPALEIEEFSKVPRKLDEGIKSLKSMEEQLKGVRANTDLLRSMDSKLDTLPKRIAEELKEVLR